MNSTDPLNPRRKRLGYLFVLLFLASALALLFRPRTQPPPLRVDPIGADVEIDFASTLPHAGGPKGYVSSASCRECHPKQFDSWHRSYHRSMTQLMTTNSVVAEFHGIQMDFMGERFALQRRDNEFWVEITDLEESASARATNGPPPEALQIRMGLVTGSHHMQVFWMPGGLGNLQMGFPFTWLIEDRRWVPRHDAFIRPPDSTPPKEIWNLTCIRCHTTAGQPRPNQEEQQFDTHAVELGISCEACHGPAERHVNHQRALAARPTPTISDAPDPIIVQPKDLNPVRASQICGSCHSIKWFDENERWTENGFRFRPGDDLEATTPIVRPNKLESQPWLQKVLAKNPDLFEAFFWSDGMIRVAGREFNGLIDSPCFQRGALSCLSCHAMHSYSEPNDQLRRGMEGNPACLQCHTELRNNLSAHTHHRPESPGSLCYNCHMPHTTYALLKAVRSHQIDSPDVRATLEAGRPNACNLCHLDQTLDWTSQHLHAWYGQAKAELSQDQRTIAASLLWLLSGDAGQRALTAWSMGWEAARSASGENWQTPHLALLLDDPYSAVRYIAYRSLRRFADFSDFAYDFIGQPGNRKTASQRALDQWNKRAEATPTNAASRLFLKPDGTFDAESAARLQQQRNDRPVRLRE